MFARGPAARLPIVVPAVAGLLGVVAAAWFWITTMDDGRPYPDPRGIPRCPPGAADDLLSGPALRCWFNGPNGQWQILSRAWAFRALVVKSEASDIDDAEEIARRFVADCGDEFSEILVYVQRGPAPRPTRIRRVQWTPRGGYETIEFVGRLTQ